KRRRCAFRHSFWRYGRMLQVEAGERADDLVRTLDTISESAAIRRRLRGIIHVGGEAPGSVEPLLRARRQFQDEAAPAVGELKGFVHAPGDRFFHPDDG